MNIAKNGAVTLGIIVLLVGCGDKKKTEHSGSSDEPTATRSTGDQTNPSGPDVTGDVDPGQTEKGSGLCIDLGDLQMESLDLEGLQDELPPVELEGKVGAALDSVSSHGTPIPIDGDRVVVPVMKCASSSCEAGILIISSDDKHVLEPLPGLDDVAASTELEFVAALADIDSDGTTDLWVGYQRRDKDGKPVLTTHHVAALSLPAMTPQWHAVISRVADGNDDPGCEGALYPADANCDGQGDVVLVQRCGAMRCLADEGEVNAGCEPGAIEEKATVYLWDAGGARYVERPPS